MKLKRMGTILTVALILLVAANVLSAEDRNVLSVEAGYAYILSARDVNPDSPHSLLFNLIRQPPAGKDTPSATTPYITEIKRFCGRIDHRDFGLRRGES